jgi:hypothetical protein
MAIEGVAAIGVIGVGRIRVMPTPLRVIVCSQITLKGHVVGEPDLVDHAMQREVCKEVTAESVSSTRFGAGRM